MKRLLISASLFSLLSCSNNSTEKVVPTSDTVKKETPPALPKVLSRDTLLKQIAALEKELFSTEQLDPEKGKKMVSLYEMYYQNYHKYPETPDFLFKAGEITENLNQPYRSIDFYTHCYEEYPAYKLHAECLFRMANLYDYKLNNYIKAKALYQEVIEQFPKSQWAKDAEAAIKLMSRSDQDIIREFEKKNGVKK